MKWHPLYLGSGPKIKLKIESIEVYDWALLSIIDKLWKLEKIVSWLKCPKLSLKRRQDKMQTIEGNQLFCNQ